MNWLTARKIKARKKIAWEQEVHEIDGTDVYQNG